MAERAERRHHRERLLNKWRKVQAGYTRLLNTVAHPFRWRRGGERVVGHELEYIEHSAVRRLNHPACDCGVCNNYKRFEKRRSNRIERNWKPTPDDFE